MNWRQSAKAAEKQIHALEKQVEDLMNYNTRAKIDITAYNKCILGMIEGKGPCGWCQEQNDCQREGFDDSRLHDVHDYKTRKG